MGSVSLSGADVININGTILNDLADQNPVDLTYPNDLVGVKAGKNGNTIYAFNNMGRLAECKIRVLLGSDDDKFLNSLLQLQVNDFSGFTLLTGQFSKRVGDGQGNISTDVYQLSGGVIKKNVEAKTAAEGDTDQSVAEYMITFGYTQKSIQ
jgi:hypothetical protein